MISAMPAVAVRHDRRKNKTKDKNNRPNRLILKPHVSKGGGTSADGSPLGSHNPSANPSRQGSPIHNIHGDHMVDAGADGTLTTDVRYGDECFYGKVSLLHFIVFFLLGGLTVLIVGAVQFKKEAGLSYLRYHFLVAGAILVGVGVLLLIIKCACFRVPLPDEDDMYEDEFLSPVGGADKKINGDHHHGSKTHANNSSKHGSPKHGATEEELKALHESKDHTKDIIVSVTSPIDKNHKSSKPA